MRRLTLLFALVLVLATPAMAQQPSVDPAALAQTRILLERTNAAAIGQQVVSALLKAQKDRLEMINPGRAAEINDVMGLMQAEFTSQLPSMMDGIAAIYARHFTIDELTQLSAFYDSPLGRKMIKEMPDILSETMSVAQTFGQVIAVKVLLKLQPEIEKRKLKVNPGSP